MELVPENWVRVFGIEAPVLELVARGTVLYLVIVAFMRFVPRRHGGELATMDIVFLLLIAEAAAHSMGDYTAVAGGVVVISTLIAWAYLLNLLSYYLDHTLDGTTA